MGLGIIRVDPSRFDKTNGGVHRRATAWRVSEQGKPARRGLELEVVESGDDDGVIWGRIA
jgi:hypothetical protein